MDSETGITWEKNERRHADRTSLYLKVTVRERGRTAQPAELTSISASGCEIQNAALLSDGSQAWVKIPGLESLLGRAVWTNGSRSGMQFEQPLHPAVAARFSNSALANVVTPGHGDGPVNVSQFPTSRRDQILMGHANDEGGLLFRKNKTEQGSTLEGMIKRSVRRTAQHRIEERYNDPTAKQAIELLIGNRPAYVSDVSASGLRARLDSPGKIGDTVSVEFGQLPAIEGRVVWIKDAHVGIDLPPNSIELSGQAA